jgi:DnaJ family protein B protein 4
MAAFGQRRRRNSCNRQSPRSSLSPSLSYILFLSLCFLWLTIAASKQGARNSQSSSSSNYYQKLGIPKTSTPEQIKKAYRKAALKHHPDKGGDAETFKDICRANEVLSDPEKRDVYDRYGQAGLDNASANSAGAGAGPQSHPFGGGRPTAGGSDFFSSQFFGGNSHPNGQSYRARSGQGQSQSGINMDLEELLRQMMNQNTDSGGSSNSFRPKPSSYSRPLPCSLEELFSGATKKLKVDLGGSSKVYKIKLKPGWKEGTKVKFPATRTLPAITFVVKEKKHAHFQRKGDDLIYRYQLEQPSRQTPLHLSIILLDGITKWSRTIPVSYLRAGQSLTISDHGMPIKGGPERGNLIIEFHDDGGRDTRSERR